MSVTRLLMVATIILAIASLLTTCAWIALLQRIDAAVLQQPPRRVFKLTEDEKLRYFDTLVDRAR